LNFEKLEKWSLFVAACSYDNSVFFLDQPVAPSSVESVGLHFLFYIRLLQFVEILCSFYVVL